MKKQINVMKVRQQITSVVKYKDHFEVVLFFSTCFHHITWKL